MKQTKLLLSLVAFFFFAASCSNDDDKPSTSGDLKISGTVMAPNNLFPISKATVKIFRGTDMIASKTTDAVGAFAIEDLPNGQLTVELSKGKFKREISLDLQADYVLQNTERNLDIFPKIAVVTGYYDEIETILINIGLVNPLTDEPAFDIIDGPSSGRPAHANHAGHSSASRQSLPTNVAFSFDDLLLDAELLNSYDIIFLNCGASESLASNTLAMDNLKEFMNTGGIVYATDWMYAYLQSMFPNGEYLTFAFPETSGSSDVAEVEILNPELALWLENQGITINPTMTVNGFLGGWQMVDSFNPATVNSWMIAESVTYSGVEYTDKGLAFTFQHGQGGAFYSSFHTHGNDPSELAIAQMMNYFVFELSGL